MYFIIYKLYFKRKENTNIELLGRISSVGKESACNAGDLSLIPGLGRSPGEGNSYPLQYSWASLVAQLVKNLPEMWETWIQYLGWKDSPGGGHGSSLQYSCLENPHGQRSLAGYRPWGCKELDMTEQLNTAQNTTPGHILVNKLIQTSILN